jgi:hypothetical protein
MRERLLVKSYRDVVLSQSASRKCHGSAGKLIGKIKWACR